MASCLALLLARVWVWCVLGGMVAGVVRRYSQPPSTAVAGFAPFSKSLKTQASAFCNHHPPPHMRTENVPGSLDVRRSLRVPR